MHRLYHTNRHALCCFTHLRRFPCSAFFLYKGNGNNGIPSLQTRPHRSHPKSLFSIPQSPAPGNMVAAAVRPIPGIGTTPHKAHQRKSHINQHSSCLHIPIKKPLLLLHRGRGKAVLSLLQLIQPVHTGQTVSHHRNISFFYAIASGRFRLQLSEVLNGADHLAGVAVLVVVPGNDLDNRRYVIFCLFSSVFLVFFSYRYSSRNVRCRTSFLQFLWTNRTRFLIDIFVSANESVSAMCGSMKNSKLKFVYVILKAFYRLHTFSPICRTSA